MKIQMIFRVLRLATETLGVHEDRKEKRPKTSA